MPPNSEMPHWRRSEAARGRRQKKAPRSWEAGRSIEVGVSRRGVGPQASAALEGWAWAEGRETRPSHAAALEPTWTWLTEGFAFWSAGRGQRAGRAPSPSARPGQRSRLRACSATPECRSPQGRTWRGIDRRTRHYVAEIAGEAERGNSPPRHHKVLSRRAAQR
jgi:hypothetical protein